MSISKLTAAAFAGSVENTLALANLNFDFSLIKFEAPPEYKDIGRCLSIRRTEEAEQGLSHVTARKLGALFASVVPEVPNLMRAYGLRASEIFQSLEHNPRGAHGDGIFADYFGADGTTIWAAATSGTPAIAVHLLACMLARVWTGPEATAIWVELVAERQRKLSTAYSQSNFDASQVAAAQVLLSREQLSRWDASARAWLRTADQANERRQKQVLLIVDNLGLKVSRRPTLYEDVTQAWTSAMMMMDKLVSGVPQSVTEGAAILGLSAWHLYPNMVVLYNGTKPIDQKDPFVAAGGLVTLGLQKRRGTDQAVSWSLPLANLRYYGDPVITERAVSSYDSRISIKQLLQLSIGSLLSCWGYKPDALFEVAEVLVSLGDLMSKYKGNLKSNWVTLLASAAGELLRCEEGPPRVEIIRLIKTGYRRYKTFLGPLPQAKLPLFDFSSPGILLGLMSEGNRILFLQDLAARLGSHDHVFIIQYEHVSSGGPTYSCLVVSPPDARLVQAKRPRDGENAMDEPTSNSSTPVVRLLSWQDQPVKICESTNEIIISATPLPKFDFGHKWDRPPEAFCKYLESRRSSNTKQGVEINWRDFVADSDSEDDLEGGTMDDIFDIDPMDSWQKKPTNITSSLSWQLPVYLHFIYGNPAKAALYVAKLDIPLEESIHMDTTEASMSRTREALQNYADPAAVYKHLTHIPPQHHERYRSLQALATVSKVYEKMNDARVDIKAACFMLSEGLWLPSWDNIPHNAIVYIDICPDDLNIEQTMSCVVMFESGLYNTAPSSLFGVFGMSAGNSLYIPDLLLPDSAGKSRTRFGSLRRVTGNLGRAGISLLISPSNLRMREVDHGSYTMINHAAFDGIMEDCFSETTLHLSFTDWEMPVDVGQYGLRDTSVYLLEAAVSVHDKGKWVGDIDILKAIASSYLLILEGPSGHAHSHNADEGHVSSYLVSIEHWEELLEAPDEAGVIKTCNNWQAQLAALALSIQRGHIAAMLPQSICWSCCTEFVTYTRARISNLSASGIPVVNRRAKNIPMAYGESSRKKSFGELEEIDDFDKAESSWFRSANTNVFPPSMADDIEKTANETKHISEPIVPAYEQAQSDPPNGFPWSRGHSKSAMYIL